MNRLKFGMLMFPVHRPDHDPTVQLEQDIELAEHADALGFDEFCSENTIAAAGRLSPTRS